MASLRGAVRKFVYAIAVLSTLLVAAIVFLPYFVDLNDYKREIVAQIKASTGRDVAIDGMIELSLLPSPRVAVGEVSIASPEGAHAPDMLRLGSAEMRVAFLPLLRGELQVDSITLLAPVIEIERLADGRLNWSLEEPAGGTDGTTGGAGGSSSMAGNVRLESVVVRDGTLVWRDAAAGTVERIEGIDLEAAAGSLLGPFHSEGSAIVRGIALTFRADVGSLERNAIPLAVYLALDGGAAAAGFKGSLVRRPEGMRATGRLSADGERLADVIAALSGGDAPAGSLLGGPFSLSGVAAVSASEMTIDDLAVDFAGLAATGTLRADFAETPRIEARFTAGRLNLDKLLGDAREASGPSISPSPGTGGDAASATGGDAAAAAFALPEGIDVSLDLGIDTMVFRGAVVRQVKLVAALEGGGVKLRKFAALLPGGSDISIAGEITAADGAPRFAGRIEATSDNLRAVLDWLDIPAPDVPADRLRNMSLLTRVVLTPRLAMLSDLDLRLDVSRLSGGVNISLNKHPAFNAIIELDRLNLDSYLAAAGAGEGTGDGGDGAPQPGQPPLAALGDLNGEIKARIGRLVYRTLQISGIEIDAGLRGGVVTLRGLSIGEVAGARIAANGAFNAPTGEYDIEYTAVTEDFGAFLSLIDAPLHAPDAGAATVRGRAAGGLERVEFDTTLSAAGAVGRIAGEIGISGPQLTGRVTAELSGDDLAETLRRFGVDAPVEAPEGDAGFLASGTFEIDGQGADVSVRFAVLGGELGAEGVVTGIVDAPAYDLAVRVEHPDLAAIAGARAAPVALLLEGRIAGDAARFRLDGLTGAIGPTEIESGSVDARFDGERPFFAVVLAAGDVTADMFAPIAAVGTGDAGGAGAEDAPAPGAGRWSSEPLRLAGLEAFDGRASVTARSLLLSPHRLDEVALEMTLSGGVLEIERLSGRAYGGKADLSGRLVATGTPTIETVIRIEGADLRALLLNAADVGELSGVLDLSGSFRTAGRSEADMVSALSGEAGISVRDGAVDGIDLARLDAQLADIDSEGDIAGLVGAALAGGSTELRSLTGSFNAEKGVLRSDDLHAVFDGAEGTGEATIDLARWRLRLDSGFKLASHAEAPAVGLILDGPIDAPRRKIRDKELRAYVVQRIAAKAIKKLVPDSDVGMVIDTILGDQPQTAPAGDDGKAPEAQPQPKNDPLPEAPFKNFLEGILKDLGG
jgi:uncharacterized protein involved in outer membrane biogenesis